MSTADSLRIVYRSETYATLPASKPTPAGWTDLRGGFATKADAQQWLWNEIDAIPEGYGLPTTANHR